MSGIRTKYKKCKINLKKKKRKNQLFYLFILKSRAVNIEYTRWFVAADMCATSAVVIRVSGEITKAIIRHLKSCLSST